MCWNGAELLASTQYPHFKNFGTSTSTFCNLVLLPEGVQKFVFCLFLCLHLCICFGRFLPWCNPPKGSRLRPVSNWRSFVYRANRLLHYGTTLYKQTIKQTVWENSCRSSVASQARITENLSKAQVYVFQKIWRNTYEKHKVHKFFWAFELFMTIIIVLIITLLLGQSIHFLLLIWGQVAGAAA